MDCPAALELNRLEDAGEFDELGALRKRLKEEMPPLGLLDALLRGAEAEIQVVTGGPNGMRSFGAEVGPEGLRLNEATVDEDGNVTNRVTGNRWEEVDPDNIDTEVMTALQRAQEVQTSLNEARTELAKLQQAVQDEDQGINSDAEVLRFDVMGVVPEKYYGQRGLEVCDDEGRVVVNNRSGEKIATLENDVGQPLLLRTQGLEQRRQTLRDNRERISLLERRVEHEPERIAALVDIAIRTMTRRQPDLALKHLRGEVKISSQDGQMVFKRRVSIDERGDQLPDRVTRMIRELAESNGDEPERSRFRLPDSLRRLVGLPVEPAITDETSDASAQEEAMAAGSAGEASGQEEGP